LAESDQQRIMEWFPHSKSRHHTEDKRNATGHTGQHE